MTLATEIIEEHKRVRENCGWFLLEDWCLVGAEGKDVFDYLQTQTTNDVQQLEIGRGQDSALVDRKARLIANFSLHRNGEHSVLFLTETCQKEKLLNHLETYHFREDVRFQALNRTLLALQGPRSPLVLRSLAGATPLPEEPNSIAHLPLDGKDLLVINKSLTGEEGYILVLDAKDCDRGIPEILEAGKEFGLGPVGDETREILRIEAGQLKYGKDIDEKRILPETGLEHSSVSYSKGCYIGQEVIARVKTYGAPNFALMGILLEEDSLPPYDGVIRLGGKKIGTVKSAVFSPALGKNVAYAYIQKDHRSPGTRMEVVLGEQTRNITTCLLPFYQAASRQELSKKILDKALKIYQEKEDLNQPIALLREAIALDPKLPAAYEALGVFLSRQNKLDEAIALMKRLAEIDPTEIMAHTNLSVYYMKQGRIEEAEKEKAEATALQFEKMVTEGMVKKQKQADQENKKKEQEQKIEMFKEVLEIDPVDPVANFGLGAIYVETGRAEEALGPLETVIRENRDYSAAYLLLGKAWEKLSKQKEAIEVYRKGIAAASRKGDLMPLKDMESRLNQLLHSDS